jgi:hypothetical protein
MNNLRKTTVLLFVGVFLISMVLVPFTPRAAVDSQVAAPISYEDALVEKYADLLENDLLSEKVDPILVSYMETGVLDESVVTTRSGDIKILLFVEPTFDTSALADIAEVQWQIDLKLTRVVSIRIGSVVGVKQLEAMGGIKYVMADRFIDREVGEPGDPVTDMFNINDVVGATGTYATDYDGSGVIVGVDDTGIDFSQSDMRGTEYNNGTHAMSYDPNGYGLTEMVIGNNTAVSNVTAWLAAGNLLTYESGGNYYLNTTGWDPVLNNIGSHRSLMGVRPPYGDGYPEGGNIGFIGLYEWAWGPVNNASEFVYNEMWRDWEIPSPGAENYTFGWIFQQRDGGYLKTFAASMYYEGQIIIDWNSSLAWTTMWENAINQQTIDLNTTVDRDAILAMMDWSFEDDFTTYGRAYDIATNTLYADGLHDGTGFMGLGSISWAYDDLGYLSADYGLFAGIAAGGMAWNALFNGESNHGHWTGSAIASQGVYSHDVYGNGTTFTLPGVAPGAKIIATKGITSGGGIMADFWAAGFHLDDSAGPYGNETYWTYRGDGPSHKADIVSNSWGWGPGAGYLQLVYYTMVYDIASVPDVLETGYPGTLFVFSAGNNGGDYGTGGTPSSAFSVVSVGATITGHYYESVYSPYTQTDSQEIYFSSNGPGFTGIVKPDVMAPGYRGANPQPSQNEWMGVGDTFAWWQGTSLAAPIAAGVAALIMEAYNTANAAMPSPQLTKDILLSSASDLGYDPFIQGHGLVNAEAAIAAIETGSAVSYYFESDSFQFFSDQIAETWAYWMPDWAPMGIYYDAGQTTPVGLETSSIFFGTVDRGQVRTVNLDVTNYAGGAVQTAAFDVISPRYYTQLSSLSFDETSYTYNDTNTNVIRPGIVVLSDNVTLTDFYAANYATITVAYDIANIAAYPVVRLFDWVDTDTNGVLNYFNFTAGVGDYIDHITRYTDQSNFMQMRVASPNGIASLFTGEPVIQFDGAAGIDFTVTIQAWQKTTDTAIGTADGTTGIDVTLTVPADAEYGAHQGMIYFEDTSSGFTHELPYSYTVEMDLDGAMGAVHTLVDGIGDELTPHDTGGATTSFYYPTTSTNEGGGLTTFHLNIPYDIDRNASVLVMRAEWDNPGTVVDMYLRRETYHALTSTDDGGRPFDPNPTGTLTNTIIYDPGALINGTYWFYYSIHRIDGADVPENITITLQLYGPTDLPDAVGDFTWTSRTSTTPTALSADDVVAGDHVVLESNWTIPAVAGLPEYSIITGSRLALLSGLYAVRTGTYADPQGTDDWPIALILTDLYVWETVEGISEGDVVQIDLDAQGGADPSFDVWSWDDLNTDGLVDLDEIGGAAYLIVDNGGSGAAESGSYSSPASEDIAIRVFCWAWQYHGDDYVLTVDTRSSQDINSEAGTQFHTSLDTYTLLRNITMDIYLYCWTETDVVWIVDFGKLTFQNFFTPVIDVNAPIDLGSDSWNFTWTASDLNADDETYFSVWLSSDGGSTFQLLRQNLTESFFVWNANGFQEGDYVYRVRVYDLDFGTMVYSGDPLIGDVPLNGVGTPPSSYWPGLFSDDVSASFTAGNVPVPTTPTPTTTTTTTTTTSAPPPATIDPLLIGLLGGLGVGVVVLLILFLIRKK